MTAQSMQNVHHKLQRNCSVSMQQEYIVHLFTHGVLYEHLTDLDGTI